MIEYTGEFTAQDENGISRGIWKRLDNGETGHGDLPVGAMWFDDFEISGRIHKGPDGKVLYVETPGGAWCIDSVASNCTKPNDKDHRCWCRHGEVPNITVDKVGNTCSAGAGSIQIGKYHGFLRNGELTDC